jgi:heat shock protein beta
LRSLVIHSLYSNKDVFLRELLSNANDALEKLRLTALTDRAVMESSGGGEANITIEVNLDEDGEGKTGTLIIRGGCCSFWRRGMLMRVDTGIGMSKDELARNLGTIARSGTNEFLKKADEGGANDGNLIGQFGVFLLLPPLGVS